MSYGQKKAVIRYNRSVDHDPKIQYTIAIFNGYEILADPEWIIGLIDHNFFLGKNPRLPDDFYIIVETEKGQKKKLEVISNTSTNGIVDILDIVVSDYFGDEPPYSSEKKNRDVLPNEEILYQIDPMQPAMLEFNRHGRLLRWNIPAAFPSRFSESYFRKNMCIKNFTDSAKLSPFKRKFDIKKVVEHVADTGKTFFYHSSGVDMSGQETLYLIVVSKSDQTADAVTLNIYNAYQYA